MTANLTKESLLISFIRTDGGTQNRAALDLDMVAEYQAAMQQGAAFPPVQVYYDGQGYWLWDGFHRVEAARRAGLTSIATEINTGTKEDAQWAAYAANKSHGLRRTNTDKERAVRAALRHARAATMSNSAIAAHVGVDDKTVAKYRAEMEASSEIPKIETREVVRGGQTYQVNTSNIGASKPVSTGTLAPTQEFKETFQAAKETFIEELGQQPVVEVPEPVEDEESETEENIEAVETVEGSSVQSAFGCAGCRFHSTLLNDLNSFRCDYLARNQALKQRRAIGAECNYYQCGDIELWGSRLELLASNAAPPVAALMVTPAEVKDFVRHAVLKMSEKALSLFTSDQYQVDHWQEIQAQAMELIKEVTQ